MNVAKLAFKTIIACICAFLLLVAAGYYFRTEKERAVNDYVAAAYAQTCSMVYVGGYLPDDTQTYAVRLNDAEEPTFLVVLQGKEVIQDTYLLACMAKEIVQNWADALYKMWGPCKVWLRLESTRLSKTPLPDISDLPLADKLQDAQSRRQILYIQPDTPLEETAVETRFMETKEFLALWGTSMDMDAAWVEATVCTGTSEGAAGFCLGANGQMQACGVPANILQILETNGLHLPVKS